MKWIESDSRVNEVATIGSCSIRRLLFAGDLILLASSKQVLQHALDQLSAACEQGE